MRVRWWCVSTGAWLASLQVGWALMLQTHLTAVSAGYVLMVAAWILGIIVGLSCVERQVAWWLVGAAVAYHGTLVLLTFLPRDAMLVIVWVGIGVCGGYSGQFFRLNRRLFSRIGSLFGWETLGFLIGWVIGTGAWLWRGESTLHLLPLLWLGIVVAGQPASLTRNA